MNSKLVPITAIFISRPNRFVVICLLKEKETKAFLPNPGKLLELLFPGVRLLLIRSESKTAKLSWRVIGVYRDEIPIMLDTHFTNDVAETLLRQKVVPSLRNATVSKREITFGKSRFDFLLTEGKKQTYLEVKSCSLFQDRMAMFPDAVTKRGTKHVQELVELSTKSRKGAVLFIAQWDKADYFLPDYHTDPEFAQTLYNARNTIDICIAAIRWSDDMTIKGTPKFLKIPWSVYESESGDRGCYLLLLKNTKEPDQLPLFADQKLRKGYYLYVADAPKNMSSQMNRHTRLRKKCLSTIDSLRQETQFLQVFPICTADQIACDIAHKLKDLADWTVPSFDINTCHCDSHLFGFEQNPKNLKPVMDLLLYYRMTRLIAKIEGDRVIK